MELRQLIGPSKADLRSFRASSPRGVPVWENLENELTDPTLARYVCSVLSTWAYSDAPTVATIMARLGLERNRCLFFQISNNASFIQSSGYLIQSHDGRVALLAYRGTDPFDFKTWVVNGDVNPATILWPSELEHVVATPAGTDEPAMHAAPQAAGQASGIFNFLSGVAQLPGQVAGAVAGAVDAGLRTGTQGADLIAQKVFLDGIVKPFTDTVRSAHSFGRIGLALEEIVLDAHQFQEQIAPEPELVVPESRVAAGFYRNQRASWYEFAAALKRALEGRSIFNAKRPIERLNLADGPVTFSDPVNKLEHLFITGHSQGAAMAQLAAYRIATDAHYASLFAKLHHVYAFAPPCVGNKAFAREFDAILKDRVSCFVYKRDVVPHLPPIIPGTLEFEPVGTFYSVAKEEKRPPEECNWPVVADQTKPRRAAYFADLLLAFSATLGDRLDVIQTTLSIIRRPSVELTIRSLILALLKERNFSIYDHFPERYMTVSALPGRKYKTELGDDP